MPKYRTNGEEYGVWKCIFFCLKLHGVQGAWRSAFMVEYVSNRRILVGICGGFVSGVDGHLSTFSLNSASDAFYVCMSTRGYD